MKLNTKNYHKVFWNCIAIFITVIMLLPFLWILSTSLRLPKDSFKLPPSFLPTVFEFGNYMEVFRQVPLLKYIGNSFFIAGLSTLAQIFITTMAAYAFARLNFKGKNILFIILLSGLMIPVQTTVIPIFIGYSKLHLVDTRIGVILPLLINPLGIFIVRQSMSTIPKNYDEAARLDGAGYWRTLFYIIIPMSKPSIMAVVVLAFVNSWNDFFRPLIFITSENKMTLPLGLTVLSGLMRTSSISIILAGVVVSAIPLLILFIVGQKYFLEGISLSGLKG